MRFVPFEKFNNDILESIKKKNDIKILVFGVYRNDDDMFGNFLTLDTLSP